MNSTFWKNIIREIKNSLGRFLAIFAIVAIGVAFFAGVTAASTDMQNSADKYYDDYNFMDLRLVSTAGFTKDDVDSIKETNGLSGVFATHTVDALTEANNTEEVVKVMTVPDSGVSQDNPEYINQLRIKEGRLPQNDDECVVRWELSKENIYNIGDTISLKSGDDNELSDTLSIQEFKVVGIVYSPYFLSYNKGTTSIGNGSVGYCIMVKNNIFCEQYYTEIFATVDGAKALDTYSESKGKYMYPGLRNTSWKLMSNNAHVMYAEFTPNDTNTSYGITYGGWVNTEDPYQDKAPEVVMSNYIIPSIESLSSLDNYSQIEHWGNYSYRIPKTAKLISEAVEDGVYDVRLYEDTGAKIRVIRSSIKDKKKDVTIIKIPTLYFLHKYNDLDTPTQYAVVWNNGIAGSLVDSYKPNSESYLRHVVRDSVYVYSYRINYDESKTSYTHKQLRDMIEYVGFDDAAKLRKESQWREEEAYKERLENSSIFSPWYMEWIKLLSK